MNEVDHSAKIQKMTLYINTKDQRLIAVGLKKDDDTYETLSDENQYGSQVLLDLITDILEKNEVNFEDLDDIEVEVGPGSFTGLRVGVSVANALAYSLNIPVNGKKFETELIYT